MNPFVHALLLTSGAIGTYLGFLFVLCLVIQFRIENAEHEALRREYAEDDEP